MEEALQRETREEISIADFSAEKIDAYVFESRYEREYVNVFKTVYDKEIRPSENELDGGRFWSRERRNIEILKQERTEAGGLTPMIFILRVKE